ncbi:hypothetical protein HD806DRAFT_54594 [Xylariaceae sp. AK1471]|nr:hypothetical protein HD806DRAFT_54594 [Xylariaceae sp. AK1471]
MTKLQEVPRRFQRKIILDYGKAGFWQVSLDEAYPSASSHNRPLTRTEQQQRRHSGSILLLGSLLKRRLDDVGSTFSDMSGCLSRDHWSLFFIGQILYPSFLHLMVLCGLYQYLWRRLRKADITYDETEHESIPLLFMALEAFHRFRRHQ